MEYKDEPPPKDAVLPQAELSPYAAYLGIVFYTGKMFPANYRGGIFVAEHGSWNRTQPIGARVTYVPVDKAGTPTPFAEGWLLVSDDTAGAIYRISYDAK